jgi:hypothetical protein
VGLSSQFLIIRTKRSKFFTPSQHWQRLMRIRLIEKILSISIWLLGMIKITLVK